MSAEPVNGHEREGGAIAGAQSQQAPKRGAPLVEVIIPPSIAVLNATPLYHFKVWPDGHIEGFEGLGGGAIVHNRVPDLLLSIGQPIFETANTLMEAVRELAKGSVIRERAGDATTPDTRVQVAPSGE